MPLKAKRCTAPSTVTLPRMDCILSSIADPSSSAGMVCIASASAGLLVAFFARETTGTGLRTTLASWSPTSVLAGAWSDLRGLFANRRVRAGLGVLFCVQFGLGATNPLMEIYVGDLWSGDPARVPQLTALLFTSLAAAGLVATPLWGRVGDRIGHARALTHAGVATAAIFLGHALVPLYAGLCVARIALGLTSTGPNTAAFGIAATETRAEHRGSAFGAVFSARAFAVSFGAMSGGTLATWIGIEGLFLFVGASVLVVLFALRPLLRAD